MKLTFQAEEVIKIMGKEKFWYVYGSYVGSVKRFECHANDIKEAIRKAEEYGYVKIYQAREVVDI